MTTMLEAKGAEYVAAWPHNIAARVGATPEAVIEAIYLATGDKALTVGDLDPATANTVVAVARRVVERAQPRCCHFCGLPLTGAQCTECV